MEWMKELVIARLVKQKVADADTQGLWEHPAPSPGAPEERIEAAADRIGVTFDDEHRAFLGHCDGWSGFWHSCDLFCTQDYVGSERFGRAMVLMETLEPLHELCGYERDELLPIAVSRHDIDVFAIARSDSHLPGRVFWFAGQLIDQFPSFSEWFLAMVDYNRLDYQQLVSGSSS
jgi:hypothetical protein